MLSAVRGYHPYISHNIYPSSLHSMEEENKVKFMKKAERTACWGARDEMWSCMDKVGEKVEQGGIIIFTSCHPRFSIKYFARKSVIRAHTIFRPKERDSRTNHISPKERDSRTYQATFLHVL